jgi:predicted Zn-dependent protease
MEGRFYDGIKPVPSRVEVRPDGENLLIVSGLQEIPWSLRQVTVERVGEEVRLTPRPGASERLIVSAAAWKALSPTESVTDRRRQATELRLVLALGAVAAAVAGFIFLGLPALSGPLARRTPPAFERQIGQNFDAQVGLAFPTCKGEAGQDALYVFGDRLETEDAVFNVRVRAVQAPMVNAFALPGGIVLVTDDLIDLASTPDELAAVIAHEVAHVQERHVMQAVWRSLGLGLLLDAVVGGGSGAGQQAVLLAGSITDLRYSRAAESQADARGQALLTAQGLSSQGMAPFFARLAARGESRDAAAVKELLSGHPDTARRVRESRARERAGEAAFTPADWAAIKAVCANTPGRFRKLKKLF